MKNDLSFEEAVKKLEAAVADLECGALSLDDALKTFENAVGLVRFCQKELENAKQKVTMLTENPDGNVTESAFSNDASDV